MKYNYNLEVGFSKFIFKNKVLIQFSQKAELHFLLGWKLYFIFSKESVYPTYT